MLPRIMSVKGVALGLLVLTLSSEFVTAGSLRSNILTQEASKLTENKNSSDCLSEKNNCNVQAPSKLEKRSIESRDSTYECYYCDGDCEDAEPVTCNAVENDKRCYIRFDESVDVTAMGCIADFETEDKIIQLIKQKLLYICDGNKCNGYENIPTPNECSACRSDNAESCATTPNLITSTVTCTLLPYTQCYQRVDNRTNGITERGCLSSLKAEEFWNCLNAMEGSDCKICTGSACNGEIIPADRPKCHRCDASNDAKCNESPASLSVCPVYNAEETCVATYDAGITRRGCSSDLACDPKSKFCQKCRGNGCNTLNLKRRAEEIYGIFQDLPLNCYTCAGEECNAGLGVVRKCEGDAFQDCLTVFDESGKVVRRGCEIAVHEQYETHCDKNPELCFNCKSNGCNTLTDAKKYQECLYCDAAMDSDCLFKPDTVKTKRKCVDGCLASLYTRKTNPNVQDFVRTCFEDIEEDDRPNCTADNNCKKCADKNNCNVDIFPEERLSCLHCNGNDCNEPQAQKCSGYSTKDQCYMFFDNQTYSAVSMGCVSDLLPNQVETAIKQYFLCDGNNCNNYDNLPEAKVCSVCNSVDDENCAIDPAKIKSTARCQAYPYTDCYSRVDKDGHTERGCFYNLETEVFRKCKNGDPSENCKICKESECNTGIYPSDRQQCHRCNSTNDATCESAPSRPQVCPIFTKEDGCVSKLEKGITQRACLSELSCEGANRKDCNSCKGLNCNIIDLTALSIGDPGQFQDLPLNCYHCDSKHDCAGNSLGLLKKCEPNRYQTCTVTFDSSGDVVARGCSDQLDTICDQNGNKCFDCKSNGCNEARRESDFIDCVFCKAEEDDKCTFDVNAISRKRKCHKACMTALYPRTNDKQPVYELIRTCLDDFDLDDREMCAAGNSDNCLPCTEPGCNTKNLGTRKSCYHCKGNDCQSAEKKTCRATMSHEQCFIEYDEMGTVVEMGCKSKYDAQDVRTLLYAKRLWLCDEDNCNDIERVPSSQKCVICSSRTDIKCAIAPAELMDETTCSRQPYTECYMRVLDDGHTERGCLSSLENEKFFNCLNGENNIECMTCAGDNCNTKIHPAERRSCHICSSNSSSTCERNPISQQICSKFTPNEQCVTLIDQRGDTLRGCSSQLTCDTSDSSNCRICNGNNCNRFNLKRKVDGKPGMWQELPLKCYVCDSVADCASSAKQSSCENNEYCMTIFDRSGAVAARGCSDAIERKFSDYCDENSSNCHNCNSNNCNTASSLSDYIDCVYCDSETNPDCVLQPEAITNRRMCNGACMTALYAKPNTNVYALSRSCLDDKDEAERVACTNENDKFCAACSDEDDDEAACNVVEFPQDRWSCHVCTDEHCEESAPEKCKYYKENEQCFMLFSDDNSILRKGCVSDLDDSYLVDNIDSLYLCNERSNCNSFENMPQPKRCIECDSLDDADCAAYPENVPFIATCTALPNTQCFTQVYSDGSTKRGCVSKLTIPQRLNCLSGNSTNCISCNDHSCNKQIYPADRRRCHICNSKDDPKCEYSPTSERVCSFYSEQEFCATKLVDGETYRGCSSDFQCDADNYQYCRLCKDRDNCNTADLKTLNIGYPGKWQGIPLKCLTCFGKEECKNDAGLYRTCENNRLQNCVTVFAEDGNVLQRGCSNQIYENSVLQAYCDAHTDNCKFCKSHGCNTAKSMNDFVDCIFCDAIDNDDCALNVANVTHRRSCHKKCMTALYPRDIEKNPAYELERGCLDDLGSYDRETCKNGNNAFCKACEDAACNSVVLPNATRLKCNVCNGKDCTEPSSQACLAYRENDQCFALFEYETNRIIRMGCASDLDHSELIIKRRSLFLCNGDNCNEHSNFPKPTGCVVCNSRNSTKCATNPEEALVAAACTDMPYTQCFTVVDEEGITRRGCLSDVSDYVFDECIKNESGKCEICDQSNCNTEVYPKDRRSCHRCDSSENQACEDSPQAFAGICPVFSDNDSCVTKIEGTRTLRGCATDFRCDSTDAKTCRICDSNNCNSINLLSGFVGEPGKWQDLPLNCYSCEGADCVSSNGAVRKCEGNNLQTCMTVFGADGKVQKRGCSDAVDETHANFCEANPDKCLACKSNGCNDAKSLDEYTDCYFCDSADGKQCSVNFGTNSRTRKCHGGCMVALYPRSSVANAAYEMSRSCLDDMDLDDREKCANGDMEYCKTCVGARCNTMAVPEVRHECFKCLGTDCEDFEAEACSAYLPDDQCFILYDNQSSIVNMGCRSDYEMDVVTALIKQKRLILCDGKNCNTPEIVSTKSCLICDSSDDSRCATNPNLVDNTLRCASLPYTDCFTRVNEAGQTERGCMASLPDETFYGCLTNSDGLCDTCTKDNCNSIDIFPENRMRCHQCDSNSNEDCESAPNSNRVCPIYDPEDTCVTNLRNSITYRGCSSSMKCYDESDKRNCRACKTPGCNSVDLVKLSVDGEPGKWQDVPLSCLHCSDENDCATGGVFKVCRDNLYQSCMTVFNVAGKKIESGCSDAVEANNTEYCGSNPDACPRCNSNGCNIATSLDDYIDCLACDTDSNGNCVSNLAGVTKTRKCYKNCMTAMYPRDNEENPAYHLARSCLDDMDLDDREACLAGKKEYCTACVGAKCNTVDIPAKRLSCNTCNGDSCQLPEQKSCPTYRDGDQCYILFDETQSVSAMGCRSEFSNTEADFLFRQKRLYLCPDDNCNNMDDLPKAQKCALCSSRTDISCAINPNALNTAVTCSNVPFTDCYSRVLSDGSTERGCVSNLYDDEFLNCLSGNSSTCHACKGDACNTRVFPEDRTRCHICDSSSDPLCEARPNSIGICPRYDAEDSCLTVYRSGETLRGCSSSLSCDGTGSRGCSKCSGIGCNTVNLAKRQDDNYGKWQDLPLRCYHCSGENCKDLSTAKVEKCQTNNEQDCAVVFNEQGVVIERGCSDAVDEVHGAYCDEHDDHCFNCKSNECNAAVSLNEFNECVYCDTNKNLSCLWQPESGVHKTRKCRGACMTALYPSDSSSNPAYDLIRTCLDDKEKTDQTTCTNGRDANCRACPGGNCNVDDLPENRLSCLYCVNGECEEPMPMKCPLYKKEDQCHIWFDNTNSVSEMGCISSFRNQDLESIIKTKRVYVCDESDNCNDLNRLNRTQKCATCDSKTDVLCAVNAKAVGTVNECSMMPYTSCFSKLNADGSTRRGCLTELDENTFASCLLGKDGNCETCNGDGCNREIYPADRQQCHTCTSLDDDDCESFPTYMQPCPVVSATESCKTGLSGNETLRGCSSEIYCDANDSKTCRACYGTSCNSIDLRNKIDDGNHGKWQTLPLQCHECIGEHCLASLGPVVTCKINIEQDCMTVFESNGTIRRRGCSDDVEDYEDLYCRQNPQLCFKCKSNECNLAWSIDEFVECTYCNSTENPACTIHPGSTDLESRKCHKECMVTMQNDDELIRSCLDDKEFFHQSDCRSESNDCASCSEGRCNKFVFPNDRLKCHVCSGSSCSSSNGEYCLKYRKNDFCFAKYEGGKVELMGCGSSQNQSDLDEWKEHNKLYSCNDSDCNDLVKLPAANECISCNSSTSPDCAQNPTTFDRFEVCQGPINECVTFIDGSHTVRGCSNLLTQSQQESCKRAGTTCAICSGDKCNSEIFPANRRKCHICNSSSDEKCIESPDAVRICPNYDAKDRCVAKYSNNLIQRGCASDLTCDINDANNCQICDTDGCNTNKFNSATIVSGGLLFTSILAFIALRGMQIF